MKVAGSTIDKVIAGFRNHIYEKEVIVPKLRRSNINFAKCDVFNKTVVPSADRKTVFENPHLAVKEP